MMARTVVATVYLLATICISHAEIIDCTQEECKEQDIICKQPDESCTINCLDGYSCFAANIQCNADTTCTINCNDEYSCLKSKIECPLNADCFVNGLNLNSLSESIIQCPITHATECGVQCNSSLACHNTLIDAQHTDKLSLYCNDNNACMDFTVKCPEFNLTNYEPNCIIAGEDESEHTNVQFFAVNGFQDIDITQYVSNIGAESVLFCGVDQTQSCVIDNSTFNCANTSSPCYLSTVSPTILPTVFPTISPTVFPTIYPTVVPTINPSISTFYPSIMPTMYPSVYPTIQPSLSTQMEIITTKIIESTAYVGDETISTFLEEEHGEMGHDAMYDAPKLVFHGHEAIYLVVFGGIMFIVLFVTSFCIYLNCKCECCKHIAKSKQRYGQVINVDIATSQP